MDSKCWWWKGGGVKQSEDQDEEEQKIVVSIDVRMLRIFLYNDTVSHNFIWFCWKRWENKFMIVIMLWICLPILMQNHQYMYIFIYLFLFHATAPKGKRSKARSGAYSSSQSGMEDYTHPCPTHFSHHSMIGVNHSLSYYSLHNIEVFLFHSIPLTHWRLVLSILGLGSNGIHACYLQNQIVFNGLNYSSIQVS